MIPFKRLRYGDEWAEYEYRGYVFRATSCGVAGYYEGGTYLGRSEEEVRQVLDQRPETKETIYIVVQVIQHADANYEVISRVGPYNTGDFIGAFRDNSEAEAHAITWSAQTGLHYTVLEMDVT